MSIQLTAERGKITHDTISFTLEECNRCGTPFMMPSSLQKALVNSHSTFYCPNGHGMNYCGKTEVQKLKEQLEDFEKKKSEREQELTNLWLDEMNKNSKLEKQIKRIHKGICPCCNRSFPNVLAHMQSKHKDVDAAVLLINQLQKKISDKAK